MIEMLKNWYNRRFSDPQAMGLAAIFAIRVYCHLLF